MNLIKTLAIFCTLALPLGPALAQEPKKTESPEIRAIRSRIADMEKQLRELREEAALIKASNEKNAIELRKNIDSARTTLVKDYGRKVLANTQMTIIRAALQMYYADTEGRAPSALEELVPDYLKDIPSLEIPGYAKTRKSVVIKKMKADDISSLVHDTGGWLYVTDASSKLYGKVFIDARAKYKGQPFFKY